MKTSDLESIMKKKYTPPKLVGLSSGSTLLNLACSGNPRYAFRMGHIYRLVGDSQSGKTWLSLSMLGEAALLKKFSKHRFIVDNGEHGALMDIRKYFGSRVADRIEPPATNKDGSPCYSELLEDFYFNLDDAIHLGKPFIYILDSMDVLSSGADRETFTQIKKARRTNKKAPGSYGTSKAAINSKYLGDFVGGLIRTNSMVFIINQSRDNLGFGFTKKTAAGGHAPKFYATLEIWSSIKGQIKRRVKGKDRQIGTLCKVQTKKNRIQGKDRTVEIPIYWSFGIDDAGSLVDYLVEESHWKKVGKAIKAHDLGNISLEREPLIRHIEKHNLLPDLKMIVKDVWDEIEAGCTLDRKTRYR